MPREDQCQQIRDEYENLKTLQQEFDLEFNKEPKTRNLKRILKLKAEFEQRRDALQEKLLIWKYHKFDRTALKSIEKKKRYTAAETLKGHTDFVAKLQVLPLPDGRIVSGSGDYTINFGLLSR